MITIKTYLFSFGTIYRMTAEDGDLMQWKDDPTCVFGYVLNGNLTIIDSAVPGATGYTYENSKGIDPTLFVGENKYQSVGNTEWVCGHTNFKNDSGFSAQLLNLAGSATLSSGSGFFVVSGSVTVDGITATQDNYFKPRAQDLTMNGNGVLIIIQ